MKPIVISVPWGVKNKMNSKGGVSATPLKLTVVRMTRNT